MTFAAPATLPVPTVGEPVVRAIDPVVPDGFIVVVKSGVGRSAPFAPFEPPETR